MAKDLTPEEKNNIEPKPSKDLRRAGIPPRVKLDTTEGYSNGKPPEPELTKEEQENELKLAEIEKQLEENRPAQEKETPAAEEPEPETADKDLEPYDYWPESIKTVFETQDDKTKRIWKKSLSKAEGYYKKKITDVENRYGFGKEISAVVEKNAAFFSRPEFKDVGIADFVNGISQTLSKWAPYFDKYYKGQIDYPSYINNLISADKMLREEPIAYQLYDLMDMNNLTWDEFTQAWPGWKAKRGIKKELSPLEQEISDLKRQLKERDAEAEKTVIDYKKAERDAKAQTINDFYGKKNEDGTPKYPKWTDPAFVNIMGIVATQLDDKGISVGWGELYQLTERYIQKLAGNKTAEPPKPANPEPITNAFDRPQKTYTAGGDDYPFKPNPDGTDPGATSKISGLMFKDDAERAQHTESAKEALARYIEENDPSVLFRTSETVLPRSLWEGMKKSPTGKNNTR